MAEPLDGIIASLTKRRFRASVHHQDQIVSEGRPQVSDCVQAIVDDAPEVIEQSETVEHGKKCTILCVTPSGTPIHVVIGYSRLPMMIVTAYSHDPTRWTADFRRRMPGAK